MSDTSVRTLAVVEQELQECKRMAAAVRGDFRRSAPLLAKECELKRELYRARKALRESGAAA